MDKHEITTTTPGSLANEQEQSCENPVIKALKATEDLPFYISSGTTSCATSSDEGESSSPSPSISACTTPPNESNIGHFIKNKNTSSHPTLATPIKYKNKHSYLASKADRPSSHPSSSNTLSDRSLSDIFGRTFISGSFVFYSFINIDHIF